MKKNRPKLQKLKTLRSFEPRSAICASAFFALNLLVWAPAAVTAAISSQYATPGFSVVFTDIDLNASGERAIGGVFTGPTLAIGEVTAKEIGTNDGFIAKKGASGIIEWIYVIGGPSSQATINAVSVSQDGSVYAVGGFQAADLTQPEASWVGSNQGIALKLSAQGELVWSRTYGSAAATTVLEDIAASPNGGVVIVGRIGQAPAPPVNQSMIGVRDMITFSLTPQGEIAWTKSFGGAGAITEGNSVAITSNGDVVVGGTYSGASLTTPAAPEPDPRGALLAKLTANGELVWSRALSSTNSVNQEVRLREIATGPSGEIVAGLRVTGSPLGNGLPGFPSRGPSDAVVIRITPDGMTTDAMSLGGTGASTDLTGLDVDVSGFIHVAGHFNAAPLQNPPLLNSGFINGYLAMIGQGGSILRSQLFWGSQSRFLFTGVAANSPFSVVGVAHFNSGNLQFPPFVQIGTSDSVLVELIQGELVFRNGFEAERASRRAEVNDE